MAVALAARIGLGGVAMIRRSRCFPVALALVLASTMLVVPAAAQGQAVNIGTNPPGSVFYAVGSGLAKVVSDAGNVRMAVQPYTGSSTFIPLPRWTRPGESP
jgi:hypothetical protein